MNEMIDQGLGGNLLLAARASSLQLVSGVRIQDILMTANGPRTFPTLLWESLNVNMSCRALLEFSLIESRLYLRKSEAGYRVTVGGVEIQPGQSIEMDKEGLCPLLKQILIHHDATDNDKNTAHIHHYVCLLVPADFLFEDPEHPRDREHQISMTLAAHASSTIPGIGLNVVLSSMRPSSIPPALQNMPFVRSVVIQSASGDARLEFSRLRAVQLAQRCNVPLQDVAQHISMLTDEARLDDINKIIQTADKNKVCTVNALTDLIRAYQNGIAHSRWSSSQLYDLISGAEEVLSQRVKGQQLAIQAVAGKLKEAWVGLNDATKGPRGIYFLSGPTGSGKTELVKSLAARLYGDENAICRFDCGEMKEAHSVARLIGAPPGYVGFDAGGVLVTRLRERPQSIVLFDEIEKAHPSIWDLFLGIAEDGRITSGNGQFASFGEAILVFTSNIGMLETVSDVANPNVSYRRQRFDRSTPYPEIVEGVRNALNDYFTNQLGRAEIWGRIGDKNLIVFDFIRDLSGITQKFIDLSVQSARRKYNLDIHVPADVVEYITDQVAAKPEKLIYGARGLREQVDSVFTNALVRFIFDHRCSHGRIDVSLDADKNVQFRLISK
nr:AAA family ATPase [uncultured Undibacterium sp.]